MFTVKVNPKNGTLVIPKKIRKQLKIVDKVSLEIKNGKLEITSLDTDLKTMFAEARENPSQFTTEEEIEKELQNFKNRIKL
jgi:bifunctional DNA-binding transcriptional regulator/antitoxin component of YhaV-PrlF toxin-antitoxin module